MYSVIKDVRFTMLDITVKTLDGRNRSFSVPDDVRIIDECHSEIKLKFFNVINVAVINNCVYNM